MELLLLFGIILIVIGLYLLFNQISRFLLYRNNINISIGLFNILLGLILLIFNILLR